MHHDAVLTRERGFSLLAVLLFVSSACSSDEPAKDEGMACSEELPDSFDLESATELVFARSCAFDSCHGPVGPKEGLSLHDEAAVVAAIGTPSKQRPELALIEPGNPDASYIVLKLRGEDIAMFESSGARPSEAMPPEAPLCAGKVELIEEWIAAGAN